MNRRYEMYAIRAALSYRAVQLSSAQTLIILLSDRLLARSESRGDCFCFFHHQTQPISKSRFSRKSVAASRRWLRPTRRGVRPKRASVHGHGIMHRDLKPSNILIDGSDQPTIADFGLVKLTDDAALAGVSAPRSALTSVGEVLGTPAYASPEQALGEAVT